MAVRSVLHDPGLGVPRHPKISEDFARIWMGDGKVQIRGGAEPVLLSGGSSLRFMIELLDGSRNFKQIVDVIYDLWKEEVGPELIRKASTAVKRRAGQMIRNKVAGLLTKMYMNGVLEDGTEGQEEFSSEELTYYGNQLLFFSRYVDVTRASANRYGLQLSLKKSRVLVFGSGSFGQSVTARLCMSGVGQVAMIDIRPSIGDHSHVTNPNPHVFLRVFQKSADAFEDFKSIIEEKALDLMVFATHRPVPKLYQWANTFCLEKRLAWTIGCVNGHEGTIGPTIFPLQTGCYACYAARRKAASSSYEYDDSYEEYLDSQSNQIKEITEFDHFSDVMAGLFAVEILKIITFFSIPVTAGSATLSIDLLTYDTRISRFLKLPRCPTCSPHNFYPTVNA